MQHGMTYGELVRLFNTEMKINHPNLSVVKLSFGSNENPREALKYNTARWLLPSPNLPTLLSSKIYPGTVIFEAFSKVSLGRGIFSNKLFIALLLISKELQSLFKY